MALSFDAGITDQIIGAAIEVHREVGPGLLESAYCRCLAREFELRGLRFRAEVQLPVTYKGVQLDCGYRLDFLVEDRVALEVKAIEKMVPVFEAQLLTYLKLSGCKTGLLIDFHVKVLKDGITRRVL